MGHLHRALSGVDAAEGVEGREAYAAAVTMSKLQQVVGEDHVRQGWQLQLSLIPGEGLGFISLSVQVLGSAMKISIGRLIDQYIDRSLQVLRVILRLAKDERGSIRQIRT